MTVTVTCQTKWILKEYENRNRCYKGVKNFVTFQTLNFTIADRAGKSKSWVRDLFPQGSWDQRARHCFMGPQIHEHGEVGQSCLRLSQPIILWLDTSHLHVRHTCGNDLRLKLLTLMSSSCIQACSLVLSLHRTNSKSIQLIFI